METGILELYGAQRRRIGDRPLDLPQSWSADRLIRLYRDKIQAHAPEYALITDLGGNAVGLFIAENAVCSDMLRLPLGRRRVPGRWVTDCIAVGSGAHQRLFMGPGVFFRQVDLGESAFLLPLLLRFRSPVAATPRSLEHEQLYEWRHANCRYFYSSQRGTWGLWNAGNTADERHEAVIRAEAPATATAMAWTLGALRLA